MRLQISPGLPTATGVAAAAVLVFVRVPARCEDSLAYNYEDYKEQVGRMHVVTQSAFADQDLWQDMHFRLTGTIDAITGATPNGVPAPAGTSQVVTEPESDRRKAWSTDLSRQFSRINVDLGYSHSRESSGYISNGFSINTLSDFNRKNTSVLLGASGTSDDVPVSLARKDLPKHNLDLIAGVTQILDSATTFTVNVAYSRQHGFLTDPYRLVQKDVEVIFNPPVFLTETFAENRPDMRRRRSVFASLNHAFTSVHGAIEADYRFYTDTWGIVSHTGELTWYQHLGKRLDLEPDVRIYTQTAANFYYYNLDTTSIIPSRLIPRGVAPFYSSDYRLSHLNTYACSLKAVWKPADWLQIEAKYQFYNMRGEDGVTPQSAYTRSKTATLGSKLIW